MMEISGREELSWMCNKDTEQVTEEEEVLLRHDRRLFEKGLSGYVTFDVLDGDALAAYTPSNTAEIWTQQHLTLIQLVQPSSAYDFDASSKQTKYRLLFFVSKAITSEVMEN